MGKIGDINNDGFNDLAVSGSSNGKGMIYIYSGARNGLKLTQIIEMSDQSSMFGFSISRGVDIDGNGYRDFAVGAPNSEIVYLFKSYPVINVHATLQSSKSQLEVTDTITLNACIKFTSSTNLKFKVRK